MENWQEVILWLLLVWQILVTVGSLSSIKNKIEMEQVGNRTKAAQALLSALTVVFYLTLLLS